MKVKNGTKNSQRFVMYIPNELRQEIENWVNKEGITLAEFGREALETHLKEKLRQERHKQLAETCKQFHKLNRKISRDWQSIETKDWPA